MATIKNFLPPDTVIVTSGGDRYRIRRAIAAGGSALVYETQREGNQRICVLKECFPDSKKFGFTRKNGVVSPITTTSTPPII